MASKDKRQKDIDAEQNYGEVTASPVSLDPDAEKAASGDRDKSTQELEGDGGKPGDTEVLAGDRQEQNQIVSGTTDIPDPKPYAAVNLERVDAVFMWNGLGRHPDQPDNTEAIEVPDGVTVTVGTIYDRDHHEFITPDEADRRRNPDRRDEGEQE
jgi:hypothetical protein